MIEKNFDFGKVTVDTKKLVIYIDRGNGQEIMKICTDNERERKQLFDWIHNHPEISQDDAAELAWQYGLCECESEQLDSAPMEVLKIMSPHAEDQVRLELVDKNRTYELRRIPDLGIFLVNEDHMIYPLGTEQNWMVWKKDRGWVKIKALDDVDKQFVDKVIGQRVERFFK